MPEISHEEAEQMRRILASFDAKRKPITIHDLNNPPKEPYKFQKFPKMLYAGSRTLALKDTIIVTSDAQLEDALKDGWSEDCANYTEQREEVLSTQYQAEANRVQEQIEAHKRRRKSEAAA